jgi:superfamily II DNA or RNA helicase
MNLDQLLPDYPPIDSPTFYMDIYKKREFYDLRNPSFFNGFFSHQWMIARFISNWTLYESLIIIHDTGTGKSGAASATFCGLKKYNPGLHTLYVTNNDTLLNNFKEEIFNLSPILYDSNLRDESKSEEEYTRRRNSILTKAGLVFTTYYKFSQEILKSPDIMKKRWNRQFIIMDEIHHLVSHDVEVPLKERRTKKATLSLTGGQTKGGAVKTPYDEILKFIQSLDFKKMLLMTATPMRDSPTEIAPLINLVLPEDQQIPIGKDFIQYYFNQVEVSPKVPLLVWKKGKEEEFLHTIKGYVSVVKQRVDIPVIYMGQMYPPMKHFRIFANLMQDQQMVGYHQAYFTDTTDQGVRSSFYSHSQQASLFVFPDGRYGISPKGIKNPYLVENKYTFSKQFIKETGLIPFPKDIVPDKLKPDQKNTLSHNLKIVRLFSSTYYQIIRQILNNRTKQMYVYCDKINGSGIMICIQLLIQFFGYSLLSKPASYELSPSPRCIFLHDSAKETTKANIPNLIRQFNDIKNYQGRNIQVIFGTDMTKEGISLKRIEQIHICSPDWNFGKLWQAKGRGIRLQSHAGMPLSTRVEIFFHCAIPKPMLDLPEIEMKLLEFEIISEQQQQQQKQQQQDQQEQILAQGSVVQQVQQFPTQNTQITFTFEQLKQSIDFYRYFLSESKDINMGNIDYALLIAAVDCQIHKNQNNRSTLINYSPECNYKLCEYKCKGFDEQGPINPVIDESTFNLFYAQDFEKETIQFIKDLYYKNTSYTLNQINSVAVTTKNYTHRQVLDALCKIIETPIEIPFYDGRFLFLNYANDVFYTSEDRFQTDPQDVQKLWISTYSFHPTFDSSSTFDDIFKKFKDSNIGNICNRLKTCAEDDNIDKAKKLLKLFTKDTLGLFFKELIYSKRNAFISWLLQKLLADILIQDPISHKWKWRKSPTATFELNQQDMWVPSQNIVGGPVVVNGQTQDHDDPSFVQKYPNIEGKKMYGFVSDGLFKVRDISKIAKDKKEKTKGKVCTFYHLDDLYSYIYNISPNLPTDEELEFDETLIAKRDKVLEMEASKLDKWSKEGINVQAFKTLIEKEELSIDDKRFIYFFKTEFSKKPKTCEFLRNLFNLRGIMTKPPIEVPKQAKKSEPKKRGRKPSKKQQSQKPVQKQVQDKQGQQTDSLYGLLNEQD